jgi:uncharacterized protein DUF3455
MATPTRFTIFSLVLLVGGCASLQPPMAGVAVPDKLKPGANESLAMIVPAKGVQIYECRAAKDRPRDYEWAFVAPEADLYDAAGNRIGRHYAGPTWELSDGSKVLGTVKELAPAPAADSIPWLLLDAKSVGPEGALSKVTHVQRVRTAGGAAYKSGCNPPMAGARIRVDYTADYYFFTQNRPEAFGSRDTGAGMY